MSGDNGEQKGFSVPSQETEIVPAITWAEFSRDFDTASRIIGDATIAHAPYVFVGQEQAQSQLAQFMLSEEGPSVAFVRGRFGTGKTALLNKVVYDLDKSGDLDATDVAYTFSNTTSTSAVYAKEDAPKVIVLEEVGRDAMPEHLASVKEARAEGRIKHLIVNGDDTLLDPRFLEAIGATEEDLVRVDFEPLTPASFKEIMRSRLNFAWRVNQINRVVGQTRLGDISGIIAELQKLETVDKYTPEIMDGLFDDEFLATMIPKTEHPVAEVRGSIAMLGDMIRSVRPADDQTAKIDGDLYLKYKELRRDSEVRSTIEEKVVLNSVQDLIREAANGEPFPAYTINELMKHVLGNNWQVEEFVRPIRDLYYVGMLRPFKRTDIDGSTSDQLLTAAFVPDSDVFLDAKYDPIQLPDYLEDGFEVPGETLEERADTLLHMFLGANIGAAQYRAKINEFLGARMRIGAAAIAEEGEE